MLSLTTFMPRLIPNHHFTQTARQFVTRNQTSKLSNVFRAQIYEAPFLNSSKKTCSTVCDQTSKQSDIIFSIKKIIENSYHTHPFSTNIKKDNLQKVLASYLAMSEAFPYLQAGAYNHLILRCIRENRQVPTHMEESFVVGAFLSFDETGGNYLLRTQGIEVLPQILDTGIHFHASLLRKDICAIVGHELAPDYRGPTKEYLENLLNQLGSSDPVNRCAMMVAFEMHAGEMIEALWKALQELHPEKDKDSLNYFKVHVGGDDPQEEYHKQLTQKMVSRCVPIEEKERFLKCFENCYALNFNWCAAICK